MKNLVEFFSIAIVLILLTACNNNKENALVEPKGPTIPTLSAAQIMDMSKNERQELERRCLGITHPTCTELKGDEFAKLKNRKLQRCRLDASHIYVFDRNEGKRLERLCDELF